MNKNVTDYKKRTNDMTTLDDIKVHVRLKLSALWAAIMFCYIYGDFWGLWRPGSIKYIIKGGGPIGVHTSQGTLLAVSVFVAIPAVMIYLSLVLPSQWSRWLNVIISVALAIIILMTLPGAWAYYLFMSAVEIVLHVIIIWYAWSWPKRATA